MVLIKECLPVMEYAIPAVEEITREKSVNIEVGLSKTNYYQKLLTGLAIDTIHLLMVFNPLLNIDVETKSYGNQSFSLNGYGEYNVNLILNDKPIIEYATNKVFENNCFLEYYYTDNERHRKRISILAYDKIINAKNKLKDKLVEIIPDCLPREAQKIRLLINDFRVIYPLSITTIYQDFEPSRFFQRKRFKQKSNQYHVIQKCNKTIEVNKSTWNFFKEMLYWEAWSQHASENIKLIYNDSTPRFLAEKFSKNITDLEKNLEDTEQFCSGLIEAVSSGNVQEKVLGLCRKRNIPPEYRRIAVNKPLRTLFKLANIKNFKEPAIERLVKFYNKRSEKKLNTEDICYRNFIDLNSINYLE